MNLIDPFAGDGPAVTPQPIPPPVKPRPPAPAPPPTPIPAPITPPAPPAVNPVDAAKATLINVVTVIIVIVALSAATLGMMSVRGCNYPGPGPGPAPVPPPAPVVLGKIWTTFIVDSQNPSQEWAQIEADPALMQGLNELGSGMRRFEKGSPYVASLHLQQYVDKVGIPVMVISDDKTKRGVASKIPGTAQEVVDQVRAFKGGGK